MGAKVTPRLSASTIALIKSSREAAERKWKIYRYYFEPMPH